jgi:hypothetical protein
VQVLWCPSQPITQEMTRNHVPQSIGKQAWEQKNGGFCSHPTHVRFSFLSSPSRHIFHPLPTSQLFVPSKLRFFNCTRLLEKVFHNGKNMSPPFT